MTNRLGVLSIALGLALALPACGIKDHFTGESTAKKIRAVGLPAPAVVVQIWDTGVTVNDDPVVGFLLAVQPAGAPAFEARTKALVSRLDVPRVQPGALLRVMYDPKDTSRVAIDPLR